MRLADFDFDLPPDRIAQHPARPRDAARLLHVARDGLADRMVRDLPTLLRPGDVLVANDTRVIPAQLTARRGDARIGITLDQPRAERHLARAGAQCATPARGRRAALRWRRPRCAPRWWNATRTAAWCWRSTSTTRRSPRRCGTPALSPCRLTSRGPAGPLPEDSDDYQTIFAQHDGAVAAPTAGLHFTPALLDALERRGVQRVTVTLHVGAGTFLPVRTDDIAQHHMHAERGEITPQAAAAINAAQRRGRGGHDQPAPAGERRVGGWMHPAVQPATPRCSSCRATGFARSICC